MTAEVTTTRLWIMRAMYLFMAIGIGANIWPAILTEETNAPRMTGVAWALIGTIGLLALLGVRHPMKMVPLLLVELTWKLVWLLAFALPQWRAGPLDPAMQTLMFEMSFGALLLVAIPWPYVWRTYIAGPAEDWRLATPATTSPV